MNTVRDKAVADVDWHILKYVEETTVVPLHPHLSSSFQKIHHLYILPPNVAAVCRLWAAGQSEQNQECWAAIPPQAKTSAAYVLASWERQSEKTFSPEGKQYLLESMVGRYLQQLSRIPQAVPFLDQHYGGNGAFFRMHSMCFTFLLDSNLKKQLCKMRESKSSPLDEGLHTEDAKNSFFSRVTALSSVNDFTIFPPEIRLFPNLQFLSVLAGYDLGRPLLARTESVLQWCERFPLLKKLDIRCECRSATDPRPNLTEVQLLECQALANGRNLQIHVWSKGSSARCALLIAPFARLEVLYEEPGPRDIPVWIRKAITLSVAQKRLALKSFLNRTHPVLLLAYTAICISLLASTLYLYSAESKR